MTHACTLEATGNGRHTVPGWIWDQPGQRIEGLRLSDLELHNVGAGMRLFDPRLPVVRDLVMERCALTAVLRCLVISESSLNFTHTGGRHPLNLCGVLFDRTTVSGSLGSLIVQDLGDSMDGPEARAAFVKLRRAHYESVPWALDLRDASFSSVPDLRNVPGAKCRLDPATQGVALRGPAVEAMRDGRIASESLWWPSLHYYFDRASYGGRDFTDYDDTVLVVPKRSKKRKAYQQGLDELRAMGVAR